MAIVSGTIGLAQGVGSVIGFDPIGELGDLASSIFGNNRGEKRANRDQLLQALYNAGVSRKAFTGVHSDHWKDLREIAEWISREGQPAIDYINRTLPAGTGSAWDDKIIQGYNTWKSRQQSQQASPNSRPQIQITEQQNQQNQVSSGDPVGSSVQGQGSNNNMLLLAGIAVAGYLILTN